MHAVAALACVLTVVARAAPVTTFVTRRGAQLLDNGVPFRFGGSNMYWVRADWQSRRRRKDVNKHLLSRGRDLLRHCCALASLLQLGLDENEGGACTAVPQLLRVRARVSALQQ